MVFNTIGPLALEFIELAVATGVAVLPTDRLIVEVNCHPDGLRREKGRVQATLCRHLFGNMMMNHC